jgi:hypothetical protein
MEHYSYIVCSEDGNGIYGGDTHFKNKIDVKESILKYVENNTKYGAIRIISDEKIEYENNVMCKIQIYRVLGNVDVHKIFIEVMALDLNDNKICVGYTPDKKEIYAEKIKYSDFLHT